MYVLSTYNVLDFHDEFINGRHFFSFFFDDVRALNCCTMELFFVRYLKCVYYPDLKVLYNLKSFYLYFPGLALLSAIL